MARDRSSRGRRPESGVVRARPATDIAEPVGQDLVFGAHSRLPETRDPIPPAGEATDKVLERVIRQLNGICRDATLNFALEVGRVIVASLYSGNLDNWRSRAPKKERSLRKLANHPDLPMSPGALYRSLAIYELCERLGIQSWKHVSTSHLRLVLPIQKDEQARFLRAAETNRWSARRLDAEIATLTKDQPSGRASRGGRKRMSQLRRRIGGIRTLVKTVNKILALEGDAVEEPSPESARATVELLRDVTHMCTAAQSRLDSFLVREQHAGSKPSKKKA
jgi:hypothetical protein